MALAGSSDLASPLPGAFPNGAQLSGGSQRGAKNARQQPKDEDKRAIAAAVAMPLPAASALSLWIQSFSREAGNHGQPGGIPSPSKETCRPQPAAPALIEDAPPAPGPVAAPAVNAGAKGQTETPQPAVPVAADADSARNISNPPANENPQLASAGDLAFAARVRAGSAAGAAAPASQRPLQPEIGAPAQIKKTAESDAGDPTVVRPVAAGAGSSLASYGQGTENSQAPSLPPAAPSMPPNPVEAQWVPQTQPKSATVPLRDISLQVAQSGAQKVEIRVVQQSGELRVAVRTGDSDLAHGLQQGLSDLVGRLQETGFRAEAWRPGGSTVQSTPVLESRTSHGASPNGDSQSYSGGSRQQEGERRQNQPQRPGWVEEMENSTTGSEQSQGVNYGIGS